MNRLESSSIAGREPVRVGVAGCGNVLAVGYLPTIERLRARGLAELREAVMKGCRGPRFTVDYHEKARLHPWLSR